jgi:uncharacterized repeat protein (TIGR01451 family)
MCRYRRNLLNIFFVAIVFTMFLGIPARGSQAQPTFQTDVDDWPMLAHDLQRSGSTPVEVEPPYSIRWVRDFYSADNETPEIVFSQVQPIVVDGLVYVGTSRNNMYALDSDTGETVWSHSAGDGSGEILHSPAVVGGVVYFGSTDGYFYALDAQSGALIWKYGLGHGGFRSSPAVTGDTVYIGGTDGAFYALNAADGSLRWHYDTGGPILNSPAIDLQRSAVYFGSEDMRAYALSLDGGRLLWRSGKMDGVSMRYYYPVIADDLVIFRTSPGNAWRALNCGDTLLVRTAGLTVSEDCTWIRENHPGLDIHATPGPGDIENEQRAIQDWLTGAQGRGHRTFYALNANTGEEAFADPAPVLWTQGSGAVGEPPVVTLDGRVLLRWRSYYGNIDNGNSAYLFSAIGELDQASGRISPFNLAAENNYFSTGIFMISDEPGVLSVGGDSVYIYSHADSVGSVSLSTHQGTVVLSTRDVPWGVGLESIFPGERNIPFGPYNNDYWERFNTFSGIASPGVTIADGKLFWISHGMLGALEHGDGPHGQIIPPLDGDPVYAPEPSIDTFDPSDLEAYVLDVDEIPDFLGASDLRSRLEAEVQDMISGERYASLLWLTGKNTGMFFFSDPSEELYVLSISLPYLSPALQDQVRTYMAGVVAECNPLWGRTLGGEGRRRELYGVVNTDMWQACQENPNCTPQPPPLEERLYHIWAYAHYAGRWDFVRDNWPAIRYHMHNEIDPGDPANLLASMDGSSLNRRVASLIGYTRMAVHLGDQVEAEWGLNAAVNGLAARIEFEQSHRPQYGEWIGERRWPDFYAYFMETTWSHGGFIPRYQGLTPEIGRALRDYAWEDVQRQDRFIETAVMAQYLTSSFAVGRIEQFTNSPTQALEVYLAKALVMQEDSETLRQYIDVPWCHGDLYYIEKLVLAIRASRLAAVKTVTPRQADYGDVLTYTITLVGSGRPMTVTDSIPSTLHYVPGSASITPDVGTLSVDSDGSLRWTGTLTAHVPLEIVYRTTVAATDPAAIRNTVTVSDGDITGDWSATIIANGHRAYMPSVARNWSLPRVATGVEVSASSALASSSAASRPVTEGRMLEGTGGVVRELWTDGVYGRSGSSAYFCR